MKIAVTGGGTGGHVYPALQVIESIQRLDPKSSCFYLGTKEGPERALCQKRGIEFFPVHSGKLRRYRSVHNLLDPFKVLLGFFEALHCLRRERPDVLFSKGGFVSVPPAVAAHLLRIPVITHESDLTPGLATRIICRFAKAVCVSTEAAAHHYDTRSLSVHVTGNPIKEEVLHGIAKEADRLFGLDPDLPLVLVLGGSQGALQINELIWKWVEEGIEGIQLFHQTGRLTYRELKGEHYYCTPFIEEHLDHLFARSTCAVSRAGAGALFELSAAHVPMILIPKGLDSTRGDQLANAELLASREAAIVLKDEEATLENLKNAVSLLIQDPLVARAMVRRASVLVKEDAAGSIARIILTHKEETHEF